MKALGTLIVLWAVCLFISRHQQEIAALLPKPAPAKTAEQLAAITRIEEANARAAAQKKELDDVYYRSLIAVRKFLKAPSTAKFSNYLTDPETGAARRSDGTIETFGWVDAQNGFGVPIRHAWHFIMSADHNPIYFQLGNEVIGEMPAANAYVNGRAAPTPIPQRGDWMLKNYRNPLDPPQRWHR